MGRGDGAIETKYADFYQERDPLQVYPVEFVVRAFLGSYPRLELDKTGYPGKRVLDLGFGDGRNMPLLHDLGLEIHGVEISREICELTRARMEELGIPVTLEIGRSCSIPYESEYFDYVLACHSCYYVDPGTTFDDNLREIYRVARGGATFIFSAPMPDTYILRGAKDLGEGNLKIVNDPYGIRNGVVFRVFEEEAEIEEALSSWFRDFHIGSCRNDFWGTEEKLWIVVCTRA